MAVRLLVFLVCTSLAALLARARAADGLDNEVLVKEAWANRQADVKSGRFVVSRRSTYGKGTRTGPRAKMKGQVIPAADETFESQDRIVFDGNKLRFERGDQAWNPEKQEPLYYNLTTVRNGELAKQLLSNTLGGFPQGYIQKRESGDSDPFIGSYHLLPIVMAYRPLEPSLSYFATLKLSEMPKEVVNGQECLAFEVGKPVGGVKRIVYVNPQQGHSVVRHLALTSDGAVHSNIDIRYRLDQGLGWVPAGWDIADRPGQHVLMFAADVKEYTLNAETPPSEFDIVFPDGTWVEDTTSGAPKKYLIKSQGVVRPIPKEDATKPYAELMSSEPGQPASRNQTPSAQKWVLLGVGLFALIGGFWFWKRAKQPRRQA